MHLLLLILSFSTLSLGLLLYFSKGKLNIAAPWIINNGLAVYTSIEQPGFEASFFFVAVGVYLICYYLQYFSLNKFCWFLIGLCVLEVVFTNTIILVGWHTYYTDVIINKTYITLVLCVPVYIQFSKLLSNVKLIVSEQTSPLNFRYYNFLQSIAYPFFLLCMCCIVLVLVHDFIDQVPYRFESVFFIVLGSSIYVFYLSYFKFSNQFKSCMAKSSISQLSKADNKSSSEIIRLNNIDKQINEKRLFLESNLTLAVLADTLQVHPKLLSGLINQHYNMTFHDYINKKRIDFAKKRLFDPDFANYTIVAIGLESGFSSRSTFYSTFKKFVGSTPTEYKKKLSNRMIFS